MAHYVIKLKIDSDEDVQRDARIWVDTDLGGGLSSEAELELLQISEDSWTAHFSSDSRRFMYRVGMRARPGSIWSLSVQTVGLNRREVLFDSDEVTMPKEWLLGVCEDVPELRTRSYLSEVSRSAS